jgi:hypothetical protein
MPIVQGMLRLSKGLLPDHILNPDVLDRPGFQSKLLLRSAPSTPAERGN